MKLKAEKHYCCFIANPPTSCSREKMKSAILYPYGPLTGSNCCRIMHAKNLALTSAIYTINISILIVLSYAWRISINVRKSGDLEDVYYGVQVAYFAIIGTQMSMIILSIMLIFGILKENPGLIVPWIIGFITFMALEAVAMVYSNVLRDHVNKRFDSMCKAEVAFFIARALMNILAMWGVLRFYNLVRIGITWKGPETLLKCEEGSTSWKRCQRRENANFVTETKSTGCFFFDFDYDDDEDDDDDEAYYNEDDDDYVYDSEYDSEEVEEDRGNCGCCKEVNDCCEDDCCEEENSEFNARSGVCNILRGSSRKKYRSVNFYQKRQTHLQHGHNHLHHHNHHRHNCRQRQRISKNCCRRTNDIPSNNNNVRSELINKRHTKYKIGQLQTKLEVIDETERNAGSGSDENDSLLTPRNNIIISCSSSNNNIAAVTV